MKKVNYNKLIPEIRSSRKKPYPVYRYNGKSLKYDYVYNETINDITYWHGCLNGIIPYTTKYGTVGVTSWDYYSESEEDCADKVYKAIKKYIRRIAKQNKKRDNGHFRRHLNWIKWLAHYERLKLEK